ncbi:hypothetical protein AAHA92_21253 [Salvia divinorum]|uniref:Uncharacterized protein n=1 Tax=Salvia divinorum TaxID=28513 RepID=A0ABD1GJU4_SALDI
MLFLALLHLPSMLLSTTIQLSPILELFTYFVLWSWGSEESVSFFKFSEGKYEVVLCLQLHLAGLLVTLGGHIPSGL